MGRHYKDIAVIALQRRESAIPKELLLPVESIRKLPQNLTTVPQTSGHFTPEELDVINTNAQEILLKIKQKIWTALEVTKAFCKAAVVAQQLVCPLFQNPRIWLTVNRPTA
jgi:amidase